MCFSLFDSSLSTTCSSLPGGGPQLQSNFVILSGDMLFDANSVVSLVSRHSLSPSSALTALLVERRDEGDEWMGRERTDFVGIDDKGRIYLKSSLMEVEGNSHLPVHKSLLRHCPSSRMRLRADLEDVGCYVISPWVVDFLLSNPDLSRSD